MNRKIYIFFLALACTLSAACKAKEKPISINVDSNRLDLRFLSVDDVKSLAKDSAQKAGFTLDDNAQRKVHVSLLSLERDKEWAVGGALELKADTVGHRVTASHEETIQKAVEKDIERSNVESLLRSLFVDLTFVLKLDHSNAEKVAEEAKQSTDPKERRLMVSWLVDKKSKKSIPFLIANLESKELNVVREAMRDLVDFKATESVSLMIDAARGRDENFRREVVFAVAEIGGDEAEAYLDTIASGEIEAGVAEAAKQALSELRIRKNRSAIKNGSAKVQE